MIEDESTPETAAYRIEDDPDRPRLEDIQPTDFALQDVLNYVFGMRDEAEDAEVPLTLIVQGVVVTGSAVTRAAWIKGVTDFGGDEEGTLAHALRAQWEADVESSLEFIERRAEAGLPAYARSFVHLKDASIIPSSASARIVAGYWRGRLSEVGGWAIGSGNFDAEQAG